jgi:hypothetical protein
MQNGGCMKPFKEAFFFTEEKQLENISYRPAGPTHTPM